MVITTFWPTNPQVTMFQQSLFGAMPHFQMHSFVGSLADQANDGEGVSTLLR